MMHLLYIWQRDNARSRKIYHTCLYDNFEIPYKVMDGMTIGIFILSDNKRQKKYFMILSFKSKILGNLIILL